MSSKVRCYLRTQRREWGLTQTELASLLPKGSRTRVSLVERGVIPPNAQEIVAYKLIFGTPPRRTFPKLYAEVEEAVMHRGYRLFRRMEGKTTALARKKASLAARMLGRSADPRTPRV